MLYKQKKTQAAKGNRFLITISVLGSAGPIRFVVNEEDLVVAVMETALKSYAREGRLPVLGSDLDDFLLYCANAESGVMAALSPWDRVGSYGVRNFMLYKKPESEKTAESETLKHTMEPRGGSGCWNAWINKSLMCKIPIIK